MAVMRRAGSDGITCYFALKAQHGGLDSVNWQERQEFINNAYPPKIQDVRPWLAKYKDKLLGQENIMQQPYPDLVKIDMVMKKLTHLKEFDLYRDTLIIAPPKNKPSWVELVKTIEKIALTKSHPSK